jgi:hypothetical protein
MLQPKSKNTYFAALMTAFVLTLVGIQTAAAQSSSSSDTPQSVAAPGTAPIKQATLAEIVPYTGPKYNNRWEVYFGLSFMNGQAGQNLPKRYNMGGIEGQGTYWLGPDLFGGHVSRLGVAADYRFEAGTTPTETSPYYNRVLVMQNIGTGGLQLRGPKNRYAAIDFHALAGTTYGIFDNAVNNYPGGSPVSSCPTNGTPIQKLTGTVGLYCNHFAPIGLAGGSIDFNESAKLAIRLSPDMVFEHFGTETREFFSISLGALYRFGKP